MSHALWVGLLIGIPVGTFAPEWAKIGGFVIALLLSDLVQKVVHSVTAHSASVHRIHSVGLHSASVQSAHFALPPWFIGALGLAFGIWSWHFARKRGLQHLGRAELRTRWTAARGISKWGWG